MAPGKLRLFAHLESGFEDFVRVKEATHSAQTVALSKPSLLILLPRMWVLFQMLNLTTLTVWYVCHPLGNPFQRNWESCAGLLPGTDYLTEPIKAVCPLSLFCYKELLLSHFAFVKIGELNGYLNLL